MSQTILVFGASGYIGQHLVTELSLRGYTVRAVARRIERLQKLQLAGVTCYSVDLEKNGDIAQLLSGVDTVYYLVHGMGESQDFIRHERRVAENVRDALRITPVKQVIFLSSLQAPEHQQILQRNRRGARTDPARRRQHRQVVDHIAHHFEGGGTGADDNAGANFRYRNA